MHVIKRNPIMRKEKKHRHIVIILAVAAVALAFRLPALSDRPMHGDEAIQAVKTGTLWETGKAEYDPALYHGPTLAYLTVPVLWLTKAGDFAGTKEWMYRLVPALCGVALALVPFLLAGEMGWVAATAAGLLLAISPVFVYYSRYYIQETPLVLFTALALAGGWRFLSGGTKALGFGPWWGILAGTAAGLMLATKETAPLALVAMIAAFLIVRRGRVDSRRFVMPGAVAAVIAALVFSGFLAHPTGILDALRSPLNYLRLAAGGGDHVHPWHYYLGLLVWARPQPGGPVWSEAAVIALSIIGAWPRRAASRPGASLLKFLPWYTAFVFVLYSAIPYKTPWCVLTGYLGVVLLAGAGCAALVRSNRPVRTAAVLLLGVAGLHLGWQAWRGSFVFASDRRNPWVYAHPVEDVKRLGQLVQDLTSAHPDGRAMLVRIVTPDYWPLPWYLRRLTRVGYWSAVPDAVDAPVVITSSALEKAVDRRLDGDYQEMYFGLRPDSLLAVRVEAGLWRRFLRVGNAAP